MEINVLSGLLMIVGGSSAFLQGIGWLPVSRNLQKQSVWLVNFGSIFKIGGPLMILAGFLKIFFGL